jgi:hypothetical protein
MRAIELNIVLEDDDGKTYVVRHGEEDAEIVREFIKKCCILCGVIEGPVLRKVTEVEGWPDCDFPGFLCFDKKDGEANGIQIDGVTPEECIHKVDGEPPSYRFRFDVTAVRVPDPERDARELCGLPEKKT